MQLSDVPTSGFAATAGLVLEALEPDRVAGAIMVRADLLDHGGVLHRGVLSSAVETVASVGAAAWFEGCGQVVGVANSTSTFSPVREGRLQVVGVPDLREPSRQQWTVEVRDPAGELVAQGVVQLVNIADAAVLQ